MNSETAEAGTRGGSPRMPRLLSFAVSLAAVLGLSLVIAWPLWSLASSSRGAYSLAFAVALAIAVVFLVAARSRRTRPGSRRKARSP